MSVNTKHAARRALRLGSLEDVSAELDRIQAAHDAVDGAGTLRTTGNWTAGQIFEHLAIFMACALDGFPSGPPAPVRWLVILLLKKKALAGGSPPAGFKIPNSAAFLRPGDETTFEQGMARLRGEIERVGAGERFTHVSPIFGRLTHEQWVVLQSGHASLHLGFIDLEGA